MSGSSKSGLLKSATSMAGATGISRVLGLIREQLIASFFGATGFTDAFFIAYRIPNLFRDLFAEGAFSAAFVPKFVKAKQVSEESARELFWELFFVLFLIVGSIALGITFGAESLVELFAPSFSEDLAKYQTAVGLTRLMASYILWTSLAALVMGALNSYKVFFLPALAPAFSNLIVIISVLVFTRYFQGLGYHGIFALGLGVLLGGLGQLFVQLPKLFKVAFRFKRPKKLFSPQGLEVLYLLGPGLLGFAATQINLLVSSILATPIVGAVSWIHYSTRLYQLPVGILGVSLGNSNLVYFSEAWKRGDTEEAKGILKRSYNANFLIMLPVMVITFAFATKLVDLVFAHGEFDVFATTMTAKALKLHILALPFYGLYKILVPVFYTLDRARIPVMSSIISIVLNIAFCLWLTPKFGFEVLAFGVTLSMMINVFIQLGFVQKKLGLGLHFFFDKVMAKGLLASGLVGSLSFYLAKRYDFSELNLLFKAISVSFALAFCLLCYIVVLYLFGERQAIDNLLSRLRRKD